MRSAITADRRPWFSSTAASVYVHPGRGGIGEQVARLQEERADADGGDRQPVGLERGDVDPERGADRVEALGDRLGHRQALGLRPGTRAEHGERLGGRREPRHGAHELVGGGHVRSLPTPARPWS